MLFPYHKNVYVTRYISYQKLQLVTFSPNCILNDSLTMSITHIGDLISFEIFLKIIDNASLSLYLLKMYRQNKTICGVLINR